MILLCNILTTLTFFLMPAPTTLYSADLTPIVDLPAGYFVMQTEGEASADAPDGFILVAYDDLTGYVRADKVNAVDYRPVTKYETTVKFKCDNDGQPVNLRAAPNKSAEILTVMPNAAEGHCYGSTAGDALIAGAGTQWHYVAYEGLRGYCYGAHVRVDATPPNIIEKEPDPKPDAPTTTEPSDDQPEKNMSTVTAIIFIVALCIPVPFIMFYLFRKPKE